MVTDNNTGERIKKLRKEKGLSQAQLAAMLGIQQGSLSEIESGKTKASKRLLLAILYYYRDIDIKWLSTGKGDMYVKEEQFPMNNQLKEEGIEYGSYEDIPYAGAGNPVDPEQSVTLNHVLIPKKLRSKSIIALRIKGDSMYPTILDGAIIGVDIQDKEIVSGGIYCLNVPFEGAVIKRIYSQKDGITLKSDNPLFPEYSYTFEELTDYNHSIIVGRVKWLFQTY